jgi:carbamoyltransferase
VLKERADEIFLGPGDSPYMLMAKHVAPEWKDRIPAIVHVDGTARVQTVDEASNPTLYRLLKEFDALTGVPVLVNTSFNIKGEPIVETPEDAINCFLGTGIDYLILHDTVMSKKALHRFLSPIIGVYSDVKYIVQSGMNA